MISTYTASPTAISSIDPSKAGSGTGVERYAHGMYFGPLNVAAHYLNSYDGFIHADAHYSIQGNAIEPYMPAYPVVDYLFKNNFNTEKAMAHFADMDGVDVLLNELSAQFKSKALKADYGVLYKAELRGIDEHDVIDWDKEMDIDQQVESALLFFDMMFTLNDLHDLPYEEYDLHHDEISSFSDAVNSFARASMNRCDDDSAWVTSSLDMNELEKLWILYALDCTSEHADLSTEQANEFTQESAVVRLSSLCHQQLSIHRGLTYGQHYKEMKATLSTHYDRADAGHFTSRFFSQKLGVKIMQCDAMFGKENDKELVVIDMDLLKSAKFEPMSKSDIELALSAPGKHENTEQPSQKNHHSPRRT